MRFALFAACLVLASSAHAASPAEIIRGGKGVRVERAVALPARDAYARLNDRLNFCLDTNTKVQGSVAADDSSVTTLRVNSSDMSVIQIVPDGAGKARVVAWVQGPFGKRRATGYEAMFDAWFVRNDMQFCTKRI